MWQDREETPVRIDPVIRNTQENQQRFSSQVLPGFITDNKTLKRNEAHLNKQMSEKTMFAENNILEHMCKSNGLYLLWVISLIPEEWITHASRTLIWQVNFWLNQSREIRAGLTDWLTNDR